MPDDSRLSDLRQLCFVWEQRVALRGPLHSTFYWKWLKRTGGGKFRKKSQPDPPVQDLLKHPMLCPDCEGIFSKLETKFAGQFKRLAKESGTLTCTEDVYRFAVSLGFRAILIGVRKDQEQGRATPDCVLDARRTWSEYLLGKRVDAGAYEHHLLMTGDLFKRRKELPRHLRMYLMNGVEMELLGSHGRAIAYTQIPGLIFCSMINSASSILWHGTRLEIGQEVSPPQSVHDVAFARLLVNQAHDLCRGLGKSQDVSYRSSIQAMFESENNELARESWSWIVADALAHRSTPVYDDWAYKCAQLNPEEPDLAWMINVTRFEIQQRPEGEITLVFGLTRGEPRQEVMFVFRGRYKFTIGMILQVLYVPGRAVLAATFLDTSDPITGKSVPVMD